MRSTNVGTYDSTVGLCRAEGVHTRVRAAVGRAQLRPPEAELVRKIEATVAFFYKKGSHEIAHAAQTRNNWALCLDPLDSPAANVSPLPGS